MLNLNNFKENLKKRLPSSVLDLIRFLRRFYSPPIPPKPIYDYSTSNQWCRIVMNQETLKLAQNNINFSNIKVLEISGQEWQKYFSTNYQSLYYPTFDICSQQLSEKFDFIIAEQVFEHLLYPYKAATNVFEMLNSGGYFLITTPFLIKYHPSPEDCTRWTETGIKHFLAECGFELDKILTGSWGNRACLYANLENWEPYNPTLHSLENEPDYPLVVWAFAQKS